MDDYFLETRLGLSSLNYTPWFRLRLKCKTFPKYNVLWRRKKYPLLKRDDPTNFYGINSCYGS